MIAPSPAACLDCGKKLEKGRLQCGFCGRVNLSKEVITDGDDTFLLTEVKESSIKRIASSPWDLCYGMDWATKQVGIAVSSATLIGGSPGAGKSSLTLQTADNLANSVSGDVMLVSAEERGAQINDRALRLGLRNRHRIRVFPVKEARNSTLYQAIKARKPSVVIVDSVNEIARDLNDQLAACVWFKELASEQECPFLIISQVNKDDELAGLQQTLHAVDTILTFRREENSAEEGEELIRVLKTGKNRFGPEGIEAYFHMTEKGLVYIGNSNEYKWSEEGPPFILERV